VPKILWRFRAVAGLTKHFVCVARGVCKRVHVACTKENLQETRGRDAEAGVELCSQGLGVRRNCEKKEERGSVWFEAKRAACLVQRKRERFIPMGTEFFRSCCMLQVACSFLRRWFGGDFIRTRST